MLSRNAVLAALFVIAASLAGAQACDESLGPVQTSFTPTTSMPDYSSSAATRDFVDNGTNVSSDNSVQYAPNQYTVDRSTTSYEVPYTTEYVEYGNGAYYQG